MAQKDVSKQTILVLVFLTILVSLLGALTVMNEVTKVQKGEYSISGGDSSSSSQGKVVLRVNRGQPTVPSTDSTQGKVQLTIAGV